jgi:hypothetical protein
MDTVTPSSRVSRIGGSRYMVPFIAGCAMLLILGVALAPTWGTVVVLGVVEGLSEFLPIS